MGNINLTIGAISSQAYVKADFLASDDTTVLGSDYLFARFIRRIRADGVSWWIDHISEDAHNKQIFFAQIINLNGSAIGATTYAAVTALLLAFMNLPSSDLIALNTPPTLSTSGALAASKIVKASPGTLFALWGYNSGGAQYLQVHNTTTLPADAAVPVITLYMAATSNFYFDVGGQYGVALSVGITICNSSTVAMKTIGAADSWLNAAFK